MDENSKPPQGPKPTPAVAPRRIVVTPNMGGQKSTPAPQASVPASPTATPKPPEKKFKSPLEHPENKRKIDHFISEHAPLIQKQINKLKAEGKIPSSVDPNDLVVSGFSGIMQAVHRYDAKTGTPFAHFANTHIRNRILDHIVNTGDIPKELMVQAKRFAAYKQRMEAKKKEAEAAASTPQVSPSAPSEPPAQPQKVSEEDDGFFKE